MTSKWELCPTCYASGGFHEDVAHAAIRQKIPPTLTWRKTAVGHTDETPVWERRSLSQGWVAARLRETGPSGLCGDTMDDHGSHPYESRTLGRFVCRGRIAGLDRREWERLTPKQQLARWQRWHDRVCEMGWACSRHMPLKMVRT